MSIVTDNNGLNIDDALFAQTRFGAATLARRGWGSISL